MVVLGIVLPLGLLSFGALVADAVGIGVRAASTAAIVGGLVAALVGGAAIPGSIPRTATTLIFASYVASLAADPALRMAAGPNLPAILALAAACVVFSGALQIGVGAARLGSLIRYVPLPVIAGFMNGVAILIVVAQVGALLGLPGLHWGFDIGDSLRQMAVPALALGVATAAFAWIVVRRLPRVPWSLAAFGFGTGAYALIRLLDPAMDMGSLLGTPAAGLLDLATFLMLVAPESRSVLIAQLPHLITTGMVIAIIGAMDALLSAARNGHECAHAPRRQPVACGPGDCEYHGWCLWRNSGGVFNGGAIVDPPRGRPRSPGRRRDDRDAAADRRVWSRVALGLVPVTVCAGIMMIVALGMFDQWTGRVLRQWRADRGEARKRSGAWLSSFSSAWPRSPSASSSRSPWACCCRSCCLS